MARASFRRTGHDRGMEAEGVLPNGALKKAGEAVVIYRGAGQFVVMAGGAAAVAVASIADAVEGRAVSLLFVPVAAVVALLASQHCSRVALCGNGDLVLRFFMRRGVTTTVEAVSSIERDVDDADWYVCFNGGEFRMSGNRSATSLVHALMRRKPTIALSGYTLPEL